MAKRIEKDSIGNVEISEDVYWGSNSQRSLANFNIGIEKFPKEFIRAYAIVKLAAAKANYSLDQLEKDVFDYINQATKEIIDDQLDGHFPLSIWQTGSGTQTNMNLNEVIANRACELAGSKKGSKNPIHPNDHVNKSQSTNDTFPTAMHVATALQSHELLLPSLDNLIKTLQDKSQQFMSTIKIGRTHLQDATPLTLGQEIGAWGYQLSDAKIALVNSLDKIYEIAAGGTAVGTGLNSHKDYAEQIAVNLKEYTKLPFKTGQNKFAMLAAHDCLVNFSGALNTLACALMKIASDIAWLSSGPRCGLAEITIPENEPGSSIMPGKVNPTQAEAMMMVCAQVMGNHTTVTIAGSRGNFQLNVFKPVIIFNILQSIKILADAMNSLNKNCVLGIEANTKRLEYFTANSLMLVTILAPKIGYDNAAKAAKKAYHDETSLKSAVVSLGYLSAVDFDDIVKPEKMLGPR